MSCKNELCHCGGKCEAEVKSSCQINKTIEGSPYYLGLDDVKVFRGTKDNMKEIPEFNYRFITDKFQRDAKRAAELAFLIPVFPHDRAATCDPEIIKDFWKKVHYDQKQKTYFYEELLTIGTQKPPTQCQLEHYYRGEYEFYKFRHEIQVLKTELVKA